MIKDLFLLSLLTVTALLFTLTAAATIKLPDAAAAAAMETEEGVVRRPRDAPHRPAAGSVEPPGLSSLQARRKFMITDILNSAADDVDDDDDDEDEAARRRRRAVGPVAAGGGGIDMRLLFPRLPLPPHHPHHRPDSPGDVEHDTDEADTEDGDIAAGRRLPAISFSDCN